MSPLPGWTRCSDMEDGMRHRIRRPANCEPGAMADRTKELASRLRVSRERLMESDMTRNTRAWRLWAACVDATVGYTREADQTYVIGLATRAGMERQVASHLLQRFNELGVFSWNSGPRGSHTPGMLTLPSGGQSDTLTKSSGGQSDTVSAPAQGVRVTPLHSNVLSRETKSITTSIDDGVHRSSGIGASDSSKRSESWEAERLARLEARPVGLCPKHGCPLAEDGRCWTCLDELYGRA